MRRSLRSARCVGRGLEHGRRARSRRHRWFDGFRSPYERDHCRRDRRDCVGPRETRPSVRAHRHGYCRGLPVAAVLDLLPRPAAISSSARTASLGFTCDDTARRERAGRARPRVSSSGRRCCSRASPDCVAPDRCATRLANGAVLLAVDIWSSRAGGTGSSARASATAASSTSTRCSLWDWLRSSRASPQPALRLAATIVVTATVRAVDLPDAAGTGTACCRWRTDLARYQGDVPAAVVMARAILCSSLSRSSSVSWPICAIRRGSVDRPRGRSGSIAPADSWYRWSNAMRRFSCLPTRRPFGCAVSTTFDPADAEPMLVTVSVDDELVARAVLTDATGTHPVVLPPPATGASAHRPADESHAWRFPWRTGSASCYSRRGWPARTCSDGRICSR